MTFRWAKDTPPVCEACGEATENEPGIHGYRICDGCADEVRVLHATEREDEDRRYGTDA